MISDPNSPEASGVGLLQLCREKYQIVRLSGSQDSDEWRENGLKYGADFWLDASYGMNGQFFNFDSNNQPPKRKAQKELT